MYVYRHHSGISKPEGHWSGRARHVYDTKKHLMRVKLSPLQLHDEAAYSCEITYEEPGRWFKDSCQDPQMTMLHVLGKPDEVVVAMENGTELEDGAILGPYTEGTNLVLRCKASGGRPIPEVSLLSLQKLCFSIKKWSSSTHLECKQLLGFQVPVSLNNSGTFSPVSFLTFIRVTAKKVKMELCQQILLATS